MGNCRLVPLTHNPRYADRVVIAKRPHGTVYEFCDATRVHAQYQVGNPVAHPPDGTIGAMRDIDGVWYWVVRD